MKVNFGIIGTSNISHWFLEAALKDNRFNFYSIYSRDSAKGEEFIKKYNLSVKVFSNLDKMLKDPNINAVYIASPNGVHYEQAKKALGNNKAVLCEKAFTANSKEALELINLAREKNILLMEAIRNIVLPNFKLLKDNIYKIGKVRRYFASYCQYSSRYDKFKEGEVLNAFKRDLANGSLMDIGVYCIHPMISLFGKPNEILGQCTYLSSGVDGQGTGIFEYKDMEGIINFSKITNSYLQSEIQGEKGSIIINKITDMKEIIIKYRNGQEELISIDQEELDMKYEISEFIDLYITGQTESKVNTLENTLIVMNVMDKMRKDFGLIYPNDLK